MKFIEKNSIPNLMTITDVSKQTGLSVASIRWHVRQNRLRPLRLGRRILFDPTQVLKDLQKLSK